MKLFFCCVLTLLALPIMAQDPFDKSQRNQTDEAEINANLFQSCQSGNTIVAQDIPLKQLKIVGIIEFNNKQKALLVDDKQQMLSLTPNDIAGQERLILQQINSNTLHFVDCQQNNILTLTF